MNTNNDILSPRNIFAIPNCPWLKEKFYLDENKIEFKGAGNYSQVYEMINKQDDCHYAVKITQINKTKKSNYDANKFLEEIKIIKENPHKNIIKIFDYFLWESNPIFDYVFVVLELAQESLTDYIKKKANLTELEFYEIVDQSFEALYHCHQNNIIHFDIKPDNIVYCGKNIFKLCDFASAKRTLGEGTFPLLTRSIDYSPFYSSPELLQIKRQGNFDEIKDAYNWSKMDVYSLGLTLWSLLGIDEKKVLEMKDLNEIQYSSVLNERIKKTIESKNFQDNWIVLLVKMLDLNPKKRITMLEAKDALRKMKSTNNTIEIFQKMWGEQCLMELVFVLDITGSMDRYIKAVSASLKHNIVNLKKMNAKKKIIVAIIFFKDKKPLNNEEFLLLEIQISKENKQKEKLKDFLNEAKQSDFRESAEFLNGLREYNDYIHIIDFTTDINFIEKKLSLGALECKGGLDTCEDLNEALKAALTLQWNPNSKMKTLIIITDAPSHGKRYHDPKILDDFQKDDENINNLENTIQKLCEKNIGIVCLEIDEITRKMYQIIESVVKKTMNGNFLLTVLDKEAEQEQENLNAWFKKTFLDDVDSLFTKQWEMYFKDKIRDSLNWNKQIDWNNSFENQKTLGYSYLIFIARLIPKTLDFYHLNELELKFTEKSENSICGWFSEDVVLKGTQSKIFLMKRKDNQERYAIKIPIDKVIKKIEDLDISSKIYLLTKTIYEAFKVQLNENVKHFQFLDLEILRIKKPKFFQECKYVICEQFLEGIFIKYNNNYGWKLPLEKGETYKRNLLCQAFSHFSYEHSKGKLLICDLQGVGNNFTDPSIHSIEEEFGNTDVGEYGIYKFFKSHECNKYCKKMKLIEKKTYKEEEIAILKSNLELSETEELEDEENTINIKKKKKPQVQKGSDDESSIKVTFRPKKIRLSIDVQENNPNEYEEKKTENIFSKK